MLTREFVQALPKAELHLHLEGAVPWAMVRAQAADLPSQPPWWADGFRFTDFTEFRGAVQTCMGCLVDAPAYGAAAGAIFRDLVAQNVRYVSIQTGVGRGGGYRPHLAADVFQKSFGLAKRPVPLDVGKVATQMVWPLRYDRDPRHVWLRQQIKAVYREF